MSRENVELIRDMLARAPRDPGALRAILADDVEWDGGGADFPGGRASYRGPDDVMAFFREWVGAFSEWGYEVGEVLAVGHSVIAEIRQWGVGRASGARVDQHFWQVWTLRDGRVIRGTNHFDRDAALAAARD